MPATVMKHEIDPREEILKKLGNISEFLIAQNEILVATYLRPEKTQGGIVLPRSNLAEDIFQSKVGLVVKIGDACEFQRTNPNTGRKYGVAIALGDWIVLKPSDNWALEVRGSDRTEYIHCRLVYDDHIRTVVSDPGSVW